MNAKNIIFTMLCLTMIGCNHNPKGNNVSSETLGDRAKNFYVEHIDDIEKSWSNNTDIAYPHIMPNKYALIDIDGDGCDELYLFNTENEDGLLFCCGNGQLHMIIGENYKSSILFIDNKVKCGGSVGTGVEAYHGYELENSQVTNTFYVRYEYGPDGEKQSYQGNNNEAEAKAFFDAIDNPKSLRDMGQFHSYSDLKGETEQAEKSPEFIIFDNSGLPDLKLGDLIPTTLEGCEIKKESYMAEGEEYPHYVVYRNGEKEIEIEPGYDIENGRFTDTVDVILIYSPNYRSSDGVYAGQLLTDCPDTFKSKKFWMYYTDVVLVDDGNIQYFLDAENLVTKPIIKVDKAAVKSSDFKPEAKIEKIRILRYDL